MGEMGRRFRSARTAMLLAVILVAPGVALAQGVFTPIPGSGPPPPARTPP